MQGLVNNVKSLALAGAAYLGGVVGNYEANAQNLSESVTIINRNSDRDDLMNRLGAIQSGDWYTFITGGNDLFADRAMKIETGNSSASQNLDSLDRQVTFPSDVEGVLSRTFSWTGAYSFSGDNVKLDRDVRNANLAEGIEGRLYLKTVGGLGQNSMENSGLVINFDEFDGSRDYFLDTTIFGQFYTKGKEVTLSDGSTVTVHGLDWNNKWMLDPSKVNHIDLPDEVDTLSQFFESRPPVPGSPLVYGRFNIWSEEKLRAWNASFDTKINEGLEERLPVSDFSRLEPRILFRDLPDHGHVTANINTLKFNYSPDEGFTGQDSFEFAIGDDFRGTVNGASTHFARVNINVVGNSNGGGGQGNSNDPPQYNGPTRHIMLDIFDKVDFPLTYIEDGVEKSYFSDSNGDRIFYSISRNLNNGNVSFDGNDVIVIDPNNGFVGDDSFEIRYTDGKVSKLEEILVSVVRSNSEPIPPTPPTFVGSSLLSVEESGVVPFDMRFRDPNPNTSLTYVFTTYPRNGRIDASDSPNMKYRPEPGFFGTDFVEIDFTDGDFTRSQRIDIVVNPVENTPPSLVGPLEIKTDEGITKYLKLESFDPNPGHDVFYTVQVPPRKGVASIYGILLPDYYADRDGRGIKFVPNPGEYGKDYMVLALTDGRTNVSQRIELDIKPTQDRPPVLGSPFVFNNRLKMNANVLTISGFYDVGLEISKNLLDWEDTGLSRRLNFDGSNYLKSLQFDLGSSSNLFNNFFRVRIGDPVIPLGTNGVISSGSISVADEILKIIGDASSAQP